LSFVTESSNQRSEHDAVAGVGVLVPFVIVLNFFEGWTSCVRKFARSIMFTRYVTDFDCPTLTCEALIYLVFSKSRE
jgi:hypothetical protein